MHGTRDAASIWGDTWSDVLKESSMKVGTACKPFGKVLEKRFEVKQTGHIGFGVNDEKELKILNRTIKIDVLNDEMT